uniref:Uncharacterized protein n=1 Tax=Knipowitschia caucasica TaxID=637954 RepID=A0AAV2JYK3_KNICA
MTFLRVANKQRRNGQNRRRLRRYFALINLFTSGRALTYCRMDRNVPILRLWFDVELELIRDFRLRRKAMHALQCLLRREQDHGWGHELEDVAGDNMDPELPLQELPDPNVTPGNATRDRLAGLI